MPVRFSNHVGIINQRSSPRNSPRLSLNTGPKSTRSTIKIKGYKVTQSQGKKRKTKVNVAKKSKRASQKKRGRSGRKRQRGGRPIINNPNSYEPKITALEDFKTLLFDFIDKPALNYWLGPSIKGILEIFNSGKPDSTPFTIGNKKSYLKDLSDKIGGENPNVDKVKLGDLLYYLAFNEKIPCKYFKQKITNIYNLYTTGGKKKTGPSTDEMTKKIITYITRLKDGKHENPPNAEITCDTNVD